MAGECRFGDLCGCGEEGSGSLREYILERFLLGNVEGRKQAGF